VDFDEDVDEEEETSKKPVGKSPATGKQTKLAVKPLMTQEDDESEDDDEEEQKPTKTTTKPISVSKQTKSAAKPSADEDD
ncbi:unnamed protein product, partial [Rotaria sp. Silwood2]